MIGQDGKETNRLDRWFSRNCKGAMPFLHEHKNTTCAKCNRDLNRLDETKKEDETEIEIMDVDNSPNDLSKGTSNSDTSGELNNSSKPMKSSENDHSLEDVKVSI